MLKTTGKSLLAGSSVLLAVATGAGTAGAVELYNKDGTKIESTVEVGLGLFHVTEDFRSVE